MSHIKSNTTSSMTEGDLTLDTQRGEVVLVDAILNRPLPEKAWRSPDDTVLRLKTESLDTYEVRIGESPFRFHEVVHVNTVGDMADALDIEGSFDFAVPNKFHRRVVDLGHSAAHIVWQYSDSSVGSPRPLSDSGRDAIKAYNEEYGTSYDTDVQVLVEVDAPTHGTYYSFG